MALFEISSASGVSKIKRMAAFFKDTNFLSFFLFFPFFFTALTYLLNLFPLLFFFYQWEGEKLAPNCNCKEKVNEELCMCVCVGGGVLAMKEYISECLKEIREGGE